MEVHSSTLVYSMAMETKKLAYQISNQLIGPILRDALFMPLHGKKVFPDSTLQFCQNLYNAEKEIKSPRVRRQILENFKITIEQVVIPGVEKSYRISYCLYESKNVDGPSHTAVRIGGRDETLETSKIRIYPLLKAYLNESPKRALTLCQFSFYEIEVQNAGQDWSLWKPCDANDLGQMFFEFLDAFTTIRKKPVDSLICHSLGSVIFEGLQDKSYENLLPKVVILDRALASVWKVGHKLYNAFSAYALYGGAYVSGWSADPETRLLEFFQQLNASEDNSLADRKIILLEVQEDEYFSGIGAFSSTFCQEIGKTGALAERIIFDPNHMSYHPRAHHALPLSKLLGDVHLASNTIFPLNEGESAATGIIRHVFLKE